MFLKKKSHKCDYYYYYYLCFGVLNAKNLTFSTPNTITLNGSELEYYYS